MGYNCEFYVNILWRTILCEHLLVAYYAEEQGTTSNFRQLDKDRRSHCATNTEYFLCSKYCEQVNTVIAKIVSNWTIVGVGLFIQKLGPAARSQLCSQY